MAVAAVAAGMLVLPACADDGPEAAPSRTVQVLTTTTTTNPYAPPAVIDVAYVNHVLAGLDRVMSDALRMVVRDRSVTPETEEYLRAIYSDGESAFPLHRDALRNDAQTALANARPSMGDQVTTVVRLISARPDCIFAEVNRDLSAVVVQSSPELVGRWWVGLEPLDPKRDSRDLNPTPWMYVYDGFQPNHQPPQDPCANS